MRLMLKQKMMVLPVVATLFLVAILVVSMIQGATARRLNERIGQELSPAVSQGQRVQSAFAVLHQDVVDAVADKSGAHVQALRDEAVLLEKDLESARALPGMNPARVNEQTATFRAYWAVASNAVTLAARGDAGADAMLVRLEEPTKAVRDLLEKSLAHDDAALRDSFTEMSTSHSTAQGWVLLLSLLCIASLAGLTFWMMREVTLPLARLTATATRIASEGDLSLPIDARSQDEVGDLARSIQTLMDRLAKVPQTLHAVVSELTSAAARLNSASHEQLNFLTNQSRSLTEASSTIAEIAQTSNMAASRAEMVLKVAAQADAFSASGQVSIEKSAEGLQQIRQRVGALVGSIGHLSEQAVHAGEIISSVKDLADQSNVLALNAAIEAARAGEEGRGFAVVAKEMRALSGQSLQSTQRIGKILLEINQAIRQTVSIAEGDSQKMEEGIEQVLSSANTLKDITTVVQESSQAARQIVASVTQQNAGIAQMTEVVTQLSEMMSDVVAATSNAEEAVTQINSSLGKLQQLSTAFRV
ncbi:methyl-accepting chemotaxis protein [Corallococcus sp. H22C18031201]|uniref:methyl-accepting chemotaxis protein n=1 Tax=Citreicoccus inhibens TaxID=2849499 RepID=UPI000E71BEF2|nr:methyl-accepting chemotaxis protein [Citreicoccus inhibens]MBU8900940.1 methyl-accepting chemotaxis protein [Citreicoccus inhibens]RJS19991.1 methyl-accepting chemotaxis protein [Corallococcus sp. H22C18031201]